MHFLRFSVRQSLQGLWRNRVMNFAATFTMILMLILLERAGHRHRRRGGRPRVRGVARRGPAELHDGLLEERGRSSFQAGAGGAARDVASVTYVSKEEALARFTRTAAEQGQPTSPAPTPASTRFNAYFTIELRDPRRVARRDRSARGADRARPARPRTADRHRPARRADRAAAQPRRHRARLRGPDRAAHRGQQHPHGAHGPGPGDRDHAPGRARRTATCAGPSSSRASSSASAGRSSPCCCCSSRRLPSATSPATSRARCRWASTSR